jgi:hypothetical protein
MTTPTSDLPVLPAQAVPAEAVVGRRIEFAYYSNLHSDEPTVWHPGIITALEPGYPGVTLACIRIDGRRNSNLKIRLDRECAGLRYLNQVVDVPPLPMGRFTPTAVALKAETHEGVPVFELEEGDLFTLTADRDVAMRAITSYAKAHGWYVADLTSDRLKSQWSVFEWEPEGADYDWLMNDAAEGDEHAIRTYYLPA